MLKVTRRTREVDVILNQQTAEDIARLGDALAEETTREQVTEAGTNRQAKATARRIEELREQADAETLKFTLRALPVSKWAQVLAAHRNENGTNDMFGTAAAALPLMLDSATIGGRRGQDRTGVAWPVRRTHRWPVHADLAGHRRTERHRSGPKSGIRPRLAGSPQLVEDLKICRQLGISYKRFLGWMPSRGDEVEWDETERNWMRSLAEYERSLCPMCGLPRTICQDPKGELTLHAETSVCWATAHMQQAMKRWTDANGRDNPAANALVAHLT